MKKNINLYLSAGLMLAFIVFTILFKYVDVKVIGTFGSEVGFASMNSYFKGLINYHIFFYLMAQFYGYITIGFACLSVVLAIVLVIVRKSIKKLDKEFYVLFGIYAFTAIILVLFRYVFVLDYRPFLIDYEQEVSYPTIQVVTSIVVYGTAIPLVKKFIKDKDLYQPITVIIYAFMGLIIVSCIISGLNWASDIIGASLFATSLVFANKFICGLIGENKNEAK